MYKISKKLKIFRENNVTNPKRSGEVEVTIHKSARENKVIASERFRPYLESFRS